MRQIQVLHDCPLSGQIIHGLGQPSQASSKLKNQWEGFVTAGGTIAMTGGDLAPGACTKPRIWLRDTVDMLPRL